MVDKKEDETWNEYLPRGGDFINDEEMNSEFSREMAEQTREAIRESGEFDCDRLRIDVDEKHPNVTIWADGWEMDAEDCVELRGELRDAGIGDESVMLVYNSRKLDKAGPNWLPDSIPRAVQVKPESRVITC